MKKMNTKDKITAIFLAGMMVCATFASVLPAMADNEATQSASVEKVGAIYIVAQNGTAAATVSTITFPSSVGGVNVSNPYNDVDTASSPQNATNATKPVIRLNNTGAITYIIHYNISTFTNDTVSNEYYNITATTENSNNISTLVIFNAQTSTDETIDAGATKNLYLKVKTNATGAGNTGTSTITILGEPE